MEVKIETGAVVVAKLLKHFKLNEPGKKKTIQNVSNSSVFDSGIHATIIPSKRQTIEQKIVCFVSYFIFGIAKPVSLLYV